MGINNLFVKDDDEFKSTAIPQGFSSTRNITNGRLSSSSKVSAPHQALLRWTMTKSANRHWSYCNKLAASIETKIK